MLRVRSGLGACFIVDEAAGPAYALRVPKAVIYQSMKQQLCGRTKYTPLTSQSISDSFGPSMTLTKVPLSLSHTNTL